MAALQPGVKMDVREHAGPKAVAKRHHARHLCWRNPVEGAAQPGLERNVPVGLEHERVQKEHAELAIADPGSPSRSRSKEPTSANTGRVPRHWTLYAEPSLRVTPSSSPRSSTSKWSNAASRSMPKVHSY